MTLAANSVHEITRGTASDPSPFNTNAAQYAGLLSFVPE